MTCAFLVDDFFQTRDNIIKLINDCSYHPLQASDMSPTSSPWPVSVLSPPAHHHAPKQVINDFKIEHVFATGIAGQVITMYGGHRVSIAIRFWRNMFLPSNLINYYMRRCTPRLKICLLVEAKSHTVSEVQKLNKLSASEWLISRLMPLYNLCTSYYY